MTEIREISLRDEPVAEKADELPQKNPSMATAALFVASLILSVMNGLGLVYAVSIVGKLSDISTKVTRLDQFEERVSQKLALLDRGMHSQFEKLDTRLIATGLSGNSFEFRTLRDAPRLLAPVGSSSGRMEATSAAFVFSEQYADSADRGFVPYRDAFLPAVDQGTRGVAPGFRRTVTRDGKIIYRRLD